MTAHAHHRQLLAAGPALEPGARSFARAFTRHAHSSGLLPDGAAVVVALSGGLDSVVLLHLLRFVEPGRLRLHAAHFDHRMRPDSRADADWARGLCLAWGVPLEIGVANAPARGEADARALRHSFLRDVAATLGADRIATAHHADDQAETVLFRLIRGSGLLGAAGIPARNGILVRPLLPFRRAQLEAWARAAGIAYRLDPTNLDARFDRNRIRNEVLPLLESIRPGAAASLARFAVRAAEARAALGPIVDRAASEAMMVAPDGALTLATEVLLRYHPHVRARVLRRALRHRGIVLGAAGTQAALQFIREGTSGGMLALPGGVRMERAFDTIAIRQERKPGSDRPLTIHDPGPGRGDAVIGGMRVEVEWSLHPRDVRGHVAVFDPSALRFPLELRACRPGDRIRLNYGSKKLKKLFAERRLARFERSRIPVLAERGDRVVWVVGEARSTLALPATDGPVLQISVSNGECA